MAAQLGGEVIFAEEGTLVFKPRGQWHAFWNAAEQCFRARALTFKLTWY